MEAAPLPEGWQTDGSKYCNLTLSLVTARGKSTAQVVAWLPAEKSDRTDFFGEPVPLFRVRYVDGATPGFEVDLEESEVRDSLVPESRAKLGMPALEPAPAAPPTSPLSAALAPAVAPAVAPPVAACVEIKFRAPYAVAASARWWSLEFPRPSTRRCRRDRIVSMAWRFTKSHAIFLR